MKNEINNLNGKVQYWKTKAKKYKEAYEAMELITEEALTVSLQNKVLLDRVETQREYIERLKRYIDSLLQDQVTIGDCKAEEFTKILERKKNVG